MDRQRLADALAYEQERRSRLASVVPMPSDGQPEVAPTPSLRSNVENLSIGLGEGLTNQLEGVRALVTDPIGTAKNAYEALNPWCATRQFWLMRCDIPPNKRRAGH
jgi:hypothetical protein